MIEVEHLSKNYGPVAALRDVSFEVGKGEVVGFVGPNGAGKSTTLRIITGFIGATEGRVRIAGHDVQRSPFEAQSSIGYMPETAPLYPEMRVGEYLGFRAGLKRVPRQRRASACTRALEQAGVSEFRGTLIGHLSKGYRQRVALADALVADPPLLILDEPTSGLDPNQIREVRKLLKDLAHTHTILLSTHILSEVEASCHRALVIHRGKIVLQGPLASLREERLTAVLTLRGSDARLREVLAHFEATDTIETIASDGPLLQVRLALKPGSPADSFESIVRNLVAAEIGVQALEPEKRRLEDVFSELTESERDQTKPEEPGQ